MSVNRHLPHVFVLPEDDANRQMANGFLLAVSSTQIQVLREAGGWASVRDQFESDHIAGMRKFGSRLMVLLVDFDGDPSRHHKIHAAVPDDLTDRVFVLGVETEPEDLKRELGSYESIGRAMGEKCQGGAASIWEHSLLKHNQRELARLNEACGFLSVPS